MGFVAITIDWAAFDVFHHQVRLSVARLSRVKEASDVRVIQLGEDLHFADTREIGAKDLSHELEALLRESGFANAEVRPVDPGIEDVFMELMNQPRERAA